MLINNVLWCTVMEVACGEYGDVVPKLVVAAQNVKFQNTCMPEMKQINSEKSVSVVDPKNLLQDGINVDNMLSSGYNELLNVQKVNGLSSVSCDKPVVCSKPVSSLIISQHASRL